MLCESYIMYVIQTFHTQSVYANIFHTNALGSINHKRDLSEKPDTYWLKSSSFSCGSCVINQGRKIFATNALEERNVEGWQAEKLCVILWSVKTGKLNQTLYSEFQIWNNNIQFVLDKLFIPSKFP